MNQILLTKLLKGKWFITSNKIKGVKRFREINKLNV